ncbi:MAG: ADP-ribosylation factor-like protein [Proteobacteria bacterium]|nr:ADP-ribosylation factor-like protein [Pseudomonadota bacterium]
MAFANFHSHEIHCKIVYFGAPGSGKTTNLRSILAQTTEDVVNGKLTLSPPDPLHKPLFEFLPVSIGQFQKHHVKVHLYALPDDKLLPTLLPVILKGIDGMIFVVDSAIESLHLNLRAWQYAQRILGEEGIFISDLPAVMQYNKQDLSNAMPRALLRRCLNSLNLPDQEAAAVSGDGVLECLHIVVEQFVREFSS